MCRRFAACKILPRDSYHLKDMQKVINIKNYYQSLKAFKHMMQKVLSMQKSLRAFKKHAEIGSQHAKIG